MSPKVLYVEDDRNLRLALARVLQPDCTVVTAEDAFVALKLISENADFEVVISDIGLPRMTGVEFHAKVSELRPALAKKFIFVSGGMPPDVKLQLENLPNQMLEKPVDLDELKRAIQAVT